MKHKFLLALLTTCFLSNNFAFAGGDKWSDLLKIIRRNKADTDSGAKARLELAQAFAKGLIGQETIKQCKAIKRLKEVIEARGPEDHEGGLARVVLIDMRARDAVLRAEIPAAHAARILGDVIAYHGAHTGTGGAARFHLVNMRLRNEIGENHYPILAIIAFMREIIANFRDQELQAHVVQAAENAIERLTLLIPAPATDEETAFERATKRAREDAEIAAQVDARLAPIAEFPPALPNNIEWPEGANNNNNNYTAPHSDAQQDFSSHWPDWDSNP